MSRSPGEFETALDELDPEERASFVAAVYDARGWESERVGTTVSVRPPVEGADSRRVAPPGVTTADGVATLSLRELRELLRYAVAPDERTRLCRRFFERSADDVGLTETRTRTVDESARRRPSAVESTVESSDGDGTGAGAGGARDRPVDPSDEPAEPADAAPNADGNGDRFAVSALSAVAVALVLTGAVAAALFWPGVPALDSAESGPVDEQSSTGNASSPLSDDDPTTADGYVVEDSAPGRQAVLETSYPPGIGVDGVENASVLAAAHRSTLSNRSYRLSVTSRESVDGRRTAVAWERTVVETPARHRSTVRVAGTFRWSPSAVANTSTYANGTKRIVRVGSNTDADGTVRFESSSVANRSASAPSHRVVGAAPSTDPFAARTASLVLRALSGAETSVTGSFERDGTTHFWIEIRPTATPSREDGGTLLVDERGLVHELRYARTVISLDSTPVRRAVTVRVTPGNVTLVPPPWYRSTDDADRRRSRLSVPARGSSTPGARGPARATSRTWG